MSRFASAILLVSLAASSLGASDPLARSRSAAEEIADYATSHHYSGAILIEHHGKVVLRSAFGLADRRFAVPNRVDTKFKLASITKLFTATLVLQLHDQGKLDLTKPIRAYLPDYKGEGGDTISIYHLLTATSGIEDFERDGDEPYIRPYTSDQLLERFCSGKLTRKPGTKFNYNNADFVILGKVVEAVSRKPYERALKEMILDPLRMRGTGLCGDQVVEGLAESYLWDHDAHVARLEPPYAIGNFYAAGAMYSTIDDLRMFSDALYGGKLLKPSSFALLLKPFLGDYGCGLWIWEYNFNGTKVDVAERQGSIGGTTNRMLRMLDQGTTIILLTNMDTADLDDMQVRIMSRFIPGVKMPVFAAAVEPASGEGKVDSAFNFVVTVTNIGGRAVENLVDVEIKDESGTKVEQIVKENLSFGEGETKTLALTWTPRRPGRYSVSVGVFQMGWKIKHYWGSEEATIQVR
jgi:D-alanyl-D-alanine carboxypeptidase